MPLPENILEKLPIVRDWILDTVASHKSQDQCVADLPFARLPLCYSKSLLQSARVVAVDKIPQLPLSKMGLPEFAEFEAGSYTGVTYLNTYYVLKEEFDYEALHFHELIHVIQWQYLGFEDFAKIYATGLLDEGYRKSPMERIAYQFQEEFESGVNPRDLEARVIGDANQLRERLLG